MYYLVVVLAIILVSALSYSYLSRGKGAPEPVILYINQGNGAVNSTNFVQMLNYATSHGFNELFFQVYREGSLLFPVEDLPSFVGLAHAAKLKIFFALYITNSTQPLPTAVYTMREDGISLDMSGLPTASQETMLAQLKEGYHGTTAVTTLDMASPLKPDMLILETYGSAYQQYIRPGVVGSVGVFTTTSYQDYQNQLEYSLKHSDGVMVFDYAGLLKAGY